jgi:ribonuclease HI
MTYAVVMVARKLKHYFQSYSTTIPTSYPLREILENKESSVRIGKWTIELSQYAIEFIARTVVKSQVLADVIADWSPSQGDEMNEDKPETPWVMYCDGAYCDDGAASSAILMSPSGIKRRYAGRLNFEGKTNNVAEYEGLLLGLRKARAIGAQRVIINTDSELITRQIGKAYKEKHDEMAKYLKTVRSMEKFFFSFTVKKIPRDQNNGEDMLAKAAAQKEPLPPDVFYEVMKCKSVDCDEAQVRYVNAISSEDWRSSIMAFLIGHYEPQSKEENKENGLEDEII